MGVLVVTSETVGVDARLGELNTRSSESWTGGLGLSLPSCGRGDLVMSSKSCEGRGLQLRVRIGALVVSSETVGVDARLGELNSRSSDSIGGLQTT
jgi:hypothetical protein